MPAIDIDRDAAHEAAQRELDKPIYPKGSLTQRLHDWIDELLYRLVEKGSSLPGGWFTVSVLLILLVVAVVVAVRIARRTMRTRRGGDYQLFDAGQLSAAQHRATAEQYAAEGNWTAAIRHRLRAVARQSRGERGTRPGSRPHRQRTGRRRRRTHTCIWPPNCRGRQPHSTTSPTANGRAPRLPTR